MSEYSPLIDALKRLENDFLLLSALTDDLDHDDLDKDVLDESPLLEESEVKESERDNNPPFFLLEDPPVDPPRCDEPVTAGSFGFHMAAAYTGVSGYSAVGVGAPLSVPLSVPLRLPLRLPSSARLSPADCGAGSLN